MKEEQLNQFQTMIDELEEIIKFNVNNKEIMTEARKLLNKLNDLISGEENPIDEGMKAKADLKRRYLDD